MKEKWKPKESEHYYYIDCIGKVRMSKIFHSPDKYETLFDFGNYFKTRKEAKAMAEKIKKLLNE